MKRQKLAGNVFEIHGEFGTIRQASDLTADELSSYGVNPSFPTYKPNCKLVTAKLVLADTPFCPEVEGMPKGMSYIIPKQALHDNFANIINMPVHITSDLSAHAEKDGDTKRYTAIGTVLGQKIVEEEGETWGQVLLALWDEDHPTETGKISANKKELGTSIEFMFSEANLERINRNIFKIWDFIPKGLAILFKNRAAFPQTQLLVAQKSDSNLPIIPNSKGEGMKKIVIETDGTIESTTVFVNGEEKQNIKDVSLSIYSDSGGSETISANYLRLVERLDEGEGIAVNKEYRLSANGVEEVEGQDGEKKTESQGGEKSMVEYKGIKLDAENYTPEAVVGFIKSFEASLEQSEERKKADAEKANKIAELEKQIQDFRDAEAKRAEDAKTAEAKARADKAKADAEAWFETNKDAYPEDQKDVVIEIRRKVNLSEATAEEIDKLATLKKAEPTLLTGGDGAPSVEQVKQIDMFYGIKNSRKDV